MNSLGRINWRHCLAIHSFFQRKDLASTSSNANESNRHVSSYIRYYRCGLLAWLILEPETFNIVSNLPSDFVDTVYGAIVFVLAENGHTEQHLHLVTFVVRTLGGAGVALIAFA